MSCPALTNKGGKLYISDQPVDCDLTLSELAVLDYLFVPGVGSIGDTGIEQDVVTYPTTDAGLTAQGKGDAVARNWDIEVLDSPSEARDILDAASAIGNDDNYATRIEWPNGDVEFSIVQVASRTAVKGAASGVRVLRYTMVPSFVPIVTNSIPVASNVLVTGGYVTGETLTATYDYYSPLGLPESGSAYQWYANRVAIPGADGLSYVIDEEYEGQMISFGVEPSDGLSFGPEARSTDGGPVIAFTLQSLFDGGTYGGLFSTAQRMYKGKYALYQDAAGTMPVTTDGDPIGLILDRSQGYDRGVVNLITWSGSGADWVVSNATVIDSATPSPLGGVMKIAAPSSSTAPHHYSRYQPSELPPVGTYTVSFYARAGDGLLYPTVAGFGLAAAAEAPIWDLQNGTVHMGATSSICKDAGMVDLGGGLYRCWTVLETVDGQTCIFSITNNTTNHAVPGWAGNPADNILVDGLMVESGDQLTPYQKKTDTLAEGGNHRYQTEAGRRAIYHTDGTHEWLLPDGIDDFYMTVEVDMKGSVESSVFAAVQWGPSTPVGKCILEMSEDPSAVTDVTALDGSANDGQLVYRHGGTTARLLFAPSPGEGSLVVVSGRGRISGPPGLQLFNDGVLVNSGTDGQGSGTLGNYPVYSLGRGAGGFFWSTPWYGDLLISRRFDDTQMAKVTETFDSLMPDPAAGEINHVLQYGQSLSVGSLGTPVISTSQAHNSLMFDVGVRTFGQGARLSFVPLVESQDGGLGETPASGTADSIKDLLEIEVPGNDYSLLLSAPGASAKTVAELKKGTSYYANLLLDVSSAHDLTSIAGGAHVASAVTWTQGERDYALSTDPEVYRSELVQLGLDIDTDASAITGQVQDVVCISYQTASHLKYLNVNGSTNAASAEIARMQLGVCLTEPNFYMACPMYMFTYVDDVHLNAESYRWLGAYYGKAYKSVVLDGEDWKPLHPTSVTGVGTSTIIVQFHVPVVPLVVDTTQVTLNDNYGFNLYDSSDVEIAITSINITGNDTVEIVAASLVPAGAYLRYAIETNGADYSGPIGGARGNLRDSQGDGMVFDPAGINKRMDNWCVIFQQEVLV